MVVSADLFGFSLVNTTIKVKSVCTLAVGHCWQELWLKASSA